MSPRHKSRLALAHATLMHEELRKGCQRANFALTAMRQEALGEANPWAHKAQEAAFAAGDAMNALERLIDQWAADLAKMANTPEREPHK